MSTTTGQPPSIDPLVLDDEEAIEALASSVMHAHERLLASGKCYTNCMTGDRAALIHGRIESVLSNAFCTIFGSPRLRGFRTSLTRQAILRNTWQRTTSLRMETRGQA